MRASCEGDVEPLHPRVDSVFGSEPSGIKPQTLNPTYQGGPTEPTGIGTGTGTGSVLVITRGKRLLSSCLMECLIPVMIIIMVGHVKCHSAVFVSAGTGTVFSLDWLCQRDGGLIKTTNHQPRVSVTLT